ncbi:MAG TPA: hypothetical protein VIY48_03715 [Candidatus Paceibacterota bacterium]
MRTIKTSAVMEHEFFNDVTLRSLNEELDAQEKLNRHYYGWTATIWATLVIGGGRLLCYAISTLPY